MAGRRSLLLWKPRLAAALTLTGVALVLLGCRHPEPRIDAFVDDSLLTGTPCAVPCWQGIVPGSTRSSEALEILRHSPYVDLDSIGSGSRDGRGLVRWQDNGPDPVGEHEITWEDDIVQDICLGLEYDMTLGELIDKYGPPEALDAMGCPPHSGCVDVIFYYPRIGMSVGGLVDTDRPRIEPTTGIGGVCFYEPQSVEERYRYIDRGAERAEQILERQMARVRPWQGYGDLFGLYYESMLELD